MKIGIDLDDVVFEFTKSFIDFYSKKYKKEVKFEEIKTYYFEEVFDISLEEVMNPIKEMVSSDIWRNLPFCDYAQESILSLAKKHKIFFITSRTIRQGTPKTLNKLFSDINFKLIFSSNLYAKINGKTKTDICYEKNIDIMVEDSKEYAKDLAEKGIRTILLDKSWNQDLEHKNIERVYNWEEILNKVNELDRRKMKNEQWIFS